MLPDWRDADYRPYIELVDLTGIRFEPMHPKATPGVHLPSAKRPLDPLEAHDRVTRWPQRILLAVAFLGMGWVGWNALVALT